ncbi:MAG: excalibur calcium-binding domain-containing protein [Caldilineaceae bacterium SB0661_bin_32]|uniref:Excalibur calcium-binding domain-containing protein n=1 Tax=Caldilineaceae bacterium SB0661_bin_32 TaxID=2605255 RepID=A0A6B1DAA0_9CHLR|nr:excalibur calcium-binding domain-containing protein [Caldilineaceae bacterium SB0661_bin_32]
MTAQTTRPTLRPDTNAREHGIAPVPRGHSACQKMNDRDNDGILGE